MEQFAQAAKPSRSTASLSVGFGLVNVPVRVYSGTNETGVKRSWFSPEGNKVRNKRVDEVTGEEVPFGAIQTLYQHEDGTVVELTDDEIEAAVGAENGKAEVVGFVDAEQMGVYVTKDVWQVRPAPGPNKKRFAPHEKAFRLLTSAMEAEGKFALVKFATRGKPRYGGLTPDGVLHVFYFADEVRAPVALPDADDSAPTEAEVAMARQLVQQFATEPVPVVNDAVERVREYVEAKVAAGEGEKPAPEAAPDQPGVTDLMAALDASLKAAA